MARVIYRNAEGGLSIIIPTPGHDAEEEAKRHVPHNTPYHIVPDNHISGDRVYRNAWEHDVANAKVMVNMTKARTIHRDHMRRVRTSLMQELDTQYMIADEKGKPADKIAIAAKKQVLRDVTSDPLIESSQTPDELKLVWPVELGPNPLI